MRIWIWMLTRKVSLWVFHFLVWVMKQRCAGPNPCEWVMFPPLIERGCWPDFSLVHVSLSCKLKFFANRLHCVQNFIMKCFRFKECWNGQYTSHARRWFWSGQGYWKRSLWWSPAGKMREREREREREHVCVCVSLCVCMHAFVLAELHGCTCVCVYLMSM